MRVLYFTRDYTTHDWRFLERLSRSRHEIAFLRLEDDGLPYERRPIPAGIRVVDWRGGRAPARAIDERLALMPDLERVIHEIEPDLIHAGPVQSCGFMAALTGFRPLLLMSWASDLLVEADRDETHRWITRYALRRSDRLLCDCDAVRHKAQSLAAYPGERVVQFPWGVDLNAFRPTADRRGVRRTLGLEGEFLVLSTRLWEDLYGIDTVLEAIRLVRARNGDVRLVLLGDGSRADEIRRLISEHNLAGAVNMPGIVPHDRLPDYFRAADLYISCALSDGSSISLLEAMATGLPVVVTDSDANREWVREEGGCLAAAGNGPAFADGVLRFVGAAAAVREAAGRANREIASKRADWEVNVARLLETYEQLGAERAAVYEP